MNEKYGRNDPCPCGSGKKYKSCCLKKEQAKRHPLGGRKFTARVISAGGMSKAETRSEEEQQSKQKPPVDYATLMERSFGNVLHSHDEKPPVPTNPSEYLVKDDTKKTP